MDGKPLKSQIIKLRRKIYDNLKSRALDLEIRHDEVEEYLAEQTRSSQRDFDVIDIETIKENVLSSDITYIGDFHTFDQNIRTVLRLLRVISETHQSCVVGLEMVHAKFQRYIDAYMERHLTDLEFLESINYHHSWRFPWTHYKEIFDLARKNNLQVIGLNTEGTLKERDQFAAQTLADIKTKEKEAKIIVLYGELHITENKIPKMVSELQPNSTYTIIHQNLDEVYWQLIDRGLEEGIVSFSANEFCVVSAPPWIKYESMIYWYENLCNDPDFDIHEYIIENGKKVFSDDTDEAFLQLSLEITSHLDLEFERELIEDFNLYDHTQLDYVEDKLQADLDPESLELFQYLIESNQSFKIPNSNFFYCSSYSVNRISSLVGCHIFHLTLKKDNIINIRNKSLSEKFIYFILQSLYSYFFSKVINPNLKCDMYGDLQLFNSRNLSLNKAKTLARKILDSNEIDFQEQTFSNKDLFEASKLSGHILGEYMYRKMTNSSESTSLKEDFLQTGLDLKLFLEMKEKVLAGQEYKKHLKRFF